MPVLLFALIRNGLAMGQYYHGARRENRKPALPPRSRPGALRRNLVIVWLDAAKMHTRGSEML